MSLRTLSCAPVLRPRPTRVSAATARLELVDGRMLEKRVEHCIGSLARPMTDAELEAKFMGQALWVLPAASVRTLLDLCWRLEALDDVAEVARASYV